MNFFLSRDNERFRALENPRGRDTASSIEFISDERERGKEAGRRNEVMGYNN